LGTAGGILRPSSVICAETCYDGALRSIIWVRKYLLRIPFLAREPPKEIQAISGNHAHAKIEISYQKKCVEPP